MIEILVSVTVLALILGVAIPGVGDWIRATRIRNLAEALQNGLQLARTEALKQNKPVTFWLVTAPASMAPPDNSCKRSSESASWVISMDDPTGKCASPTSSSISPKIFSTYGANQEAAGVTISGLAEDKSNTSFVTFNAFGQVVRDGSPLFRVEIHADDTARQLAVEISPGGSVRMCDRAFAKDSGDPRACTQF